MLKILTDSLALRLDYILNFIISDLCGYEFTVTTNPEEFTAYNGPKIAYTEKKYPGSIWLKPHGLLSGDNIENFTPPAADTSWGKIFFQSEGDCDVPFDLFAASFYILVRYEEYLPFQPDKLGRFSAGESILYKNGLLDIPVIDIWTEKLKEMITSHFGFTKHTNKAFSFIPTIDIDNAFAYKGKGFIRSAGGFAKSLFSADIHGFIERAKVLSGKKDLYDTYDYLKEIHNQYSLSPMVFVLAGKYGKYDKNVSPVKSIFKDLINSLPENFEIALHPSYRSNFSSTLKEEKAILEQITGKSITASRQHFLMLKFPETYNNLTEAGISRDFSMGYADTGGFRAGTCSPYRFFDLKSNKSKNLTIYPFPWMDRTLSEHLSLNPEKSCRYIRENMNMIKSLKGTFVSLWHNESLCDTGVWKDRKQVYEFMLKETLS